MGGNRIKVDVQELEKGEGEWENIQDILRQSFHYLYHKTLRHHDKLSSIKHQMTSNAQVLDSKVDKEEMTLCLGNLQQIAIAVNTLSDQVQQLQTKVHQREDTIIALNKALGTQQETFEKQMFTMQQQIQQLMDKTHSQDTILMALKQQQQAQQQQNLDNRLENLIQRIEIVEEEMNEFKKQDQEQMLSKETVKSMIQRQLNKQLTKLKEEKASSSSSSNSMEEERVQQQQYVLTMQRLTVHDQVLEKMITQIQDLSTSINSFSLDQEKDINKEEGDNPLYQQLQQLEQRVNQMDTEMKRQKEEDICQMEQFELKICQLVHDQLTNSTQQLHETMDTKWTQVQQEMEKLVKRKVKQFEQTLEELKRIFHLTKKEVDDQFIHLQDAFDTNTHELTNSLTKCFKKIKNIPQETEKNVHLLIQKQLSLFQQALVELDQRAAINTKGVDLLFQEYEWLRNCQLETQFQQLTDDPKQQQTVDHQIVHTMIPLSSNTSSTSTTSTNNTVHPLSLYQLSTLKLKMMNKHKKKEEEEEEEQQQLQQNKQVDMLLVPVQEDSMSTTSSSHEIETTSIDSTGSHEIAKKEETKPTLAALRDQHIRLNDQLKEKIQLYQSMWTSNSPLVCQIPFDK